MIIEWKSSYSPVVDGINEVIFLKLDPFSWKLVTESILPSRSKFVWYFLLLKDEKTSNVMKIQI